MLISDHYTITPCSESHEPRLLTQDGAAVVSRSTNGLAIYAPMDWWQEESVADMEKYKTYQVIKRGGHFSQTVIQGFVLTKPTVKYPKYFKKPFWKHVTKNTNNGQCCKLFTRMPIQ